LLLSVAFSDVSHGSQGALINCHLGSDQENMAGGEVALELDLAARLPSLPQLPLLVSNHNLTELGSPGAAVQVWYVNTPEEELPPLMLDAQGKQHKYSVPRGALRPEVAEQCRQRARRVSHGSMRSVVVQARGTS
jgi:hypothetical protein